jgi:hypothetical protein
MSTRDFTTMTNPRFLYLADQYRPFPDWVVEEPMPDASQFQKCASVAFADPAHRLLPIATKSAAFHSMLNCMAYLDHYGEDVFERVKSACARFGIEEDVAPYATLFCAEHEKAAAAETVPDGQFALDEEIGGVRVRLLPINDAQDVRDSASALLKMAAERRIHALQLPDAARNLVKAAEAFDVERLPALVRRFGEERLTDPARTASLLAGRERFKAVPAEDARVAAAMYKQAAQELADGTIDPEECVIKIAAVDRQLDISYTYSGAGLSALPTPHEVVFCGPTMRDAEKAATENVLINDVLVPLGVINKIPKIEADYSLSKEASEQFRRLHGAGDARELGFAIAQWGVEDRNCLLRLALAADKGSGV